MIGYRQRFTLVLVFACVTTAALADGVPPMQVQITEREPDTFLVQWRVSTLIPAGAEPRPVLPEACEPDGPPITVETPGSRLHAQTYRCSGGLAGRTIVIDYPLASAAMSTLLRVELLSGERHAHAFASMETTWRVPDAGAGGLAAWLDQLQATVLAGLRHPVTQPALLLLILALVLLGGASGGAFLVTAFAAGQLAGLAGATLLGAPLPHPAAAACVALAVVFLAREARRPEAARRRLGGLVVLAGGFHGLSLAGLPAAGDRWQDAVVFLVGMDAVLLALMLAAAGLGRLAPRGWRSGRIAGSVNGLVGGAAVAVVLILVVTGPEPVATAGSAPELPLTTSTAPSGAARAGRIGPSQADAPIQSFVTVEPFAVRHEALLRLRHLAGVAGVSGDSLPVSVQAEVVARLAELVASRTGLTVDGRAAAGAVDRAGFVTVDVTGVLPRAEAVFEALDTAVVGVTVVYPVAGMPHSVTFGWTGFPAAAPAIPATIIDPEATLADTLSAAAPTLTWRNALMADPVPVIAEVDVRSATAPVPVISLVLLLAATALVMAAPRLRVPAAVILAAPRLIFALALVMGPLAQVTVALPGQLGARVTEAEARRVLGGLLPGVYRAFEFRDEDAVHDRLAVSVTGDALTDIYLEQRQAMVMQERGGARARMEAVALLELDDVQAQEDGGFTASAAWTVSGTVTHFGHRHFRQNRYDARVGVVPENGQWKIAAIEVLGLERVR